MGLTNVVKRLVPAYAIPRARLAYRTAVGPARRVLARYSTPRAEARNPPAAEIFGDVYKRNAWGGDAGSFYSGGGSDGLASRPYVEFLRGFLAEGPVSELTVVDIGCGDFRVGGQLVASTQIRYVGIDVVPALIQRNQRLFGSREVSFLCLDAVTEPLPTGDILLVRQVLQHLSNAKILQLLGKFYAYQHVFVTEHYLSEDRGVVANIDKPQGADIRLPWSAVYLDRPPFALTSARLVLTVKLDDWSELRTFHVSPGVEGVQDAMRPGRRSPFS